MASEYQQYVNEVNMRDDVARDITYGRYQLCGTCNAVVPSSTRKHHANFHATFTNRKDTTVSNVLWCDEGNHAFKNGAPGSIHFEGEQRDEHGNLDTVIKDVCAEHNPMAPKSSRDNAQLQRLTARAEGELNGGIAD